MDFAILVKDVSTNGISLIAVVIGLTQFVKGFGVSGLWIRLTAFLLGASAGVSYQVLAHGAPVTFPDWFRTVVFGLIFGLAAPGVYAAAEDASTPDSKKTK